MSLKATVCQVAMARWTREEEMKLLELHQTRRSYKERAEALGRSEGSVATKLHWLKKEAYKTERTERNERTYIY